MAVEKSYRGSDPIQQYCSEMTCSITSIQRELLEATLKIPGGGMAGAPEVISMNMHFMRLIGARNVLDVGTFTGISALAAALTIPEDGKVISMDITDDHYNKCGKEIIAQSGVAHKIDLRIQPASKTLQDLINSGEAGTFDFAFIDAFKQGYPEYYEQCLQLLRPRGVMVFDNALWGGRAARQTPPERMVPEWEAVRKTNQMARDDPGVDSSLINVGDGMLIVFKKYNLSFKIGIFSAIILFFLFEKCNDRYI